MSVLGGVRDYSPVQPAASTRAPAHQVNAWEMGQGSCPREADMRLGREMGAGTNRLMMQIVTWKDGENPTERVKYILKREEVGNGQWVGEGP